ncbi:MAG TPA: DUF6429 family protein [Allosphingosinicella sp.]
MGIDTAKIDEATLALLTLGLHEECRAWKGFDWGSLDRLHEAGLIHQPRGKQKSVVFTEEGLEQARAAFDRLFGSNGG